MAMRHHRELKDLERVDVGVRPQALRLVPPALDGMNGHVFLREPLGLQDEVLVEMADGTRVKVVTEGGEEFFEGSAVSLTVEVGDLYLFRSDSKTAIY